MKTRKEFRPITVLLPIFLSLAVLLLPACDGDGGVVLAPGEDQDPVEVLLTQTLTFEPNEVTIAPGTTVRWVNVAPVYHTITPEGHDEWIQATLQEAGETFEHTFQNAGVFPYYCDVHQDVGMVGTIIVQ